MNMHRVLTVHRLAGRASSKSSTPLLPLLLLPDPLICGVRRCRITSRCCSTRGSVGAFQSTTPARLPLKAGTPIPGMDIYKEKDAPVALERHEYPDWLESLAKPLPSLAALRRMPEEDATDRDKMRYLKLTRRVQIKKNNEAMAGTKR
jgi:Mitochondrial ribosomal protein L37